MTVEDAVRDLVAAVAAEPGILGIYLGARLRKNHSSADVDAAMLQAEDDGLVDVVKFAKWYPKGGAP
jgi:hypothetical protein